MKQELERLLADIKNGKTVELRISSDDWKVLRFQFEKIQRREKGILMGSNWDFLVELWCSFNLFFRTLNDSSLKEKANFLRRASRYVRMELAPYMTVGEEGAVLLMRSK